MTCIPFGNKNIHDFICDFTDYDFYFCLEHTTYRIEFGRFGPFFYRLEGNREVEVECEFDEDFEVISKKFLWDAWEEYHQKIGERR